MNMKELRESYPRATSYIEEAVDDHDEKWVLNNYTKVMQLGVMMSVPDKEELRFFDPAKHEAMSEDEKSPERTRLFGVPKQHPESDQTRRI